MNFGYLSQAPIKVILFKKRKRSNQAKYLLFLGHIFGMLIF